MPFLLVVQITPKILEDVTIHGRPYTAGETPTLRYSTATFLTRPTDTPPMTPHEVLLLSVLDFEQSAFTISQGWLELGGIHAGDGGEIVLNNGGSEFDNWDKVSIDGAAVLILRGEYLADDKEGLIPEPLADFDTWFDGLAVGRPRISDDTCSIDLLDFTAGMDVELDTRPFLGLGGALEFGTAGNFGEVKDPDAVLDPGMAALTVIGLVRTDSFTFTSIVSKGPNATSPFGAAIIAGGLVRGFLRTGSGAVSVDSTTVYAADVWFWWVLRYDGATAQIYTADLDGSNFTAGATAAQTGSTVSIIDPLELGRSGVGSSELAGRMAHLRIYDAALGLPAIQDQLGRLLDMDAPADTDNLLLNIPADDRFGSFASDISGNALHALLTNTTWSTTGTGRPDLRDKPHPLTMGRRRSVPLTLIDRLDSGDIYSCNYRSIREWVFIFSGAVGLVGPFSLVSTAIRFDSKRQLVIATGGILEGIVPDQQINVVGSVSNDKVLTVDGEYVRPDEVRVLETLIDEPAGASVTITSVSPAWSVFDAGDANNPTLVLISGAHGDSLTATVEGDDAGPGGYADTFEEQATILASEVGPASAGDLDFSSLGSLASTQTSFYVGTEPVTALEALRRHTACISAAIVSSGSGTIEWVVVDFGSTADPVARFVQRNRIGDGLVLSLDRADLKAPPERLRLGYEPATEILSESDIPPGAWGMEADFAREPFRWAEIVLASPPAGWPTWARVIAAGDFPLAVGSDVIETDLVRRVDGEAQALIRAASAPANIFPARLSGHLPANLRIGDKLYLEYPRHGFKAGVEVWVIGFVLHPDENVIEVDVATP